MKRNILIAILCLLMILLCSACFSDFGKEAQPKNGKTYDIEKLRGMDDATVQQAITPLIVESVKEIPAIHLDSVEIIEDELLLEPDTSIKTLNNMSVKAYFHFKDELSQDDATKAVDAVFQHFLTIWSESHHDSKIRIQSLAFVFPDEKLNKEMVSVQSDPYLKQVNRSTDERMILLDD